MANILIVDPQAGIRKTLREILEYEGYEIMEAADGYNAFVAIKKNKFDLIMMAVKMPSSDGFEILERCLVFVPQIPIIILSGYGEMEKAVMAVRKGAFDYIAIPPDLNRLIIAVKNATEKHSFLKEIARISNEPYSNILKSEIHLPKELRLGFQQYLLFFEDYVRKVKGLEIKFNVTQTKNGLLLKLTYTSGLSPQIINDWLKKEYINHISDENNELQINYETEIKEQESNILTKELKNQIQFFHNNFEIAKTKNESLKKRLCT